ncbi:MAG: hypothetical protein KatS3mg108_1859 [Isosphaeraceae bacterium]|jgi:uncharacterized protein (TIRG00374 family)|nr:MAG: hypothetical protein KatS3mg108_1859 [Isosphaeraceae bacterium]
MSDGTTPPRSRPTRLVLKLLISITLLGAVIAAHREPLADVVSQRPAAGPYTLALILYLGGVVLAFFRWFLLVRAQDLPFRFQDAHRLGWIGMLFNIVIPGAVGGDVVKAAYLARMQHHKGRAIASVIIDRLVGLLGLFLLTVLAGAGAWGSLDPRARPIVVVASIAFSVVLGLLVLILTIHRHIPLGRRFRPGSRGHHLLMELHAAGVAYRRRRVWVAAAIALATVTHVANVAAFSLVAQALYATSAPSPLDCFTIAPLVLFSTAIPLPLSGLGATETVGAFLFRLVGFDGGAVVMLGFRLLQAVAATIGGWVYLTSPASVRTTRDHAGPASEPAAADAVIARN